MIPFEYAVALTGGIATGKSTFVNLMFLNGLRVIDADKIAHQLLDDNAHVVSDMFGTNYIDGGVVDRKLLGGLIFSNTDKRLELENFLHPLIYDEIEKKAIKEDRLKFAYLIDIPLFFEKDSYKGKIKSSVVVYTPKELQIQRLMSRDNLDYNSAKSKIELQMDIEQKASLSTWVVDNSKDIKHLIKESDRFLSILEDSF